MSEFTVAVNRITYYSIKADSENEAIDLVLEGEGEEVNDETTEAYVTYEDMYK